MHMMACPIFSGFNCVPYKTIVGLVMVLFFHSSNHLTLQADFLNLGPNTVGYYTADTDYAWNNTSGLGQISSTLIGSTQATLANKQHRTYMIFDTFQANSGIISASIDFGITWWTNSRGGQPSVPNFNLFVGLPQGITAADFASSHPMYSNSGRSQFDALANNSLGSVTVTAAPNTIGSGSVVWYTVNLPLSFVAAFNQAQMSGGSRYITLSVTADNPFLNKAEITEVAPNGTILRVNTISSVPEPQSIIGLGLGLVIVIARRRRRSN